MIKVHVNEDIGKRVSKLMYGLMRSAVSDAKGFALVDNPAYADWCAYMSITGDTVMVAHTRSDVMFEVSNPSSMIARIRRTETQG